MYRRNELRYLNSAHSPIIGKFFKKHLQSQGLGGNYSEYIVMFLFERSWETLSAWNWTEFAQNILSDIYEYLIGLLRSIFIRFFRDNDNGDVGRI